MQDERLRVAVAVRVVDNYGDAGVAWRLARQLHAEHDCDVALWIDAPQVLARFVHGVDPALPASVVAGVRVRRLPARDAPSVDVPPLAPPPHVVIDAFGGGLSDAWLDAMALAHPAPLWLVLEHLSAEDWVEGTHGLASPPPLRALARWFFFPGFTPRTGGLLRERGLLAARDAFRARPDHRTNAWADAGLAAPAEGTLAVSVFCYPDPALAGLLDAWSRETRPVAVLVPEGVGTTALHAFAGRAIGPGTTLVRGALSLGVAPFVDQDAFDRRLWACDFAIVRGEDSFVRAQWAAVPFAWHIYPQDDDAHRAKLDAFLDRYVHGLAPATARALAGFTHAFNAGDAEGAAKAWPAVRDALPALRAHAARWAAALAAQDDLATRLVAFVRSRL